MNEWKLQNLSEKIIRISEQRKLSYSFEISPAKTDAQLQHLMKSAAVIVRDGSATVASVTWHLSSSPSSDWSSVPAIRVACGLSKLLKLHGETNGGVLLNLSAAGLKKHDVTAVLETACQKGGVQALFIVRGDGTATGGHFAHAIDLLKFVRDQPLGKKLSIGVAGHPLGHPECPSYEEDLLHLREKDDKMLLRLCKLCRIPLPQELLSQLSSTGPRGGLQWCAELSEQLVSAGVTGIHFFTLNSIDNLKEVLNKLPSHAHSAGTTGCDEHRPSDTESKDPLKTVTL